MTEVESIADQLVRAYAGEAWYGPALRPMLDALSPEAAARRPLAARHSVWQLVLHLAANIDFVLARLDGRELELAPEVDWPPVPEASEAAWRAALAALDSRHDALLARVRALPDAALDATVPGRAYSTRVMLLGILQHNVYHAGQVALLR
jgi:uncharacterized damage-inducible protein DinB